MKNLINIELIEEYMKENKMSKTKFCKLCKIGVRTFNKVKEGENFSLRILFKISKVLNIEVYKLFN